MSRDVRPPVQMRRGTGVSSRISTHDSDIPLSCQMKDEPAFKPLLLYSVEHGIAMEPMKGKWASSRVDLGYTELFCIPEVHQCSSRFVTVFLLTLWCSIKKIEAHYMFDWNMGLLCMQCRGIEPHFPARGLSHTISRVAARTCDIYPSYSGDGHSKLHFVQ